jgi:class 3 adenylate cyclase
VQGLPTGTVTFLFTDVDGSTRLLKLLGSRYGEVMAEHRRILRDIFREHSGHEIDTQGDALFVAFSRAKDAVRGAVAAQRALAAHHWPEGADVRVRMALHTGEPEMSGEGYFGLGVHRAARICAAGHGGQILLSRSTAGVFEEDEVAGVELLDLGERRLKDLERAERIYQVIAEGLPEQFPPLNTLDREERERQLLEAARAAELPTGTLTFLFTDLEGYTTLLGTMPGEEAAQVMDDHDRLLREAFVAAGGRVIDNSGDSFLACFETAKDGAKGAAACHRALAAHVWPAGSRVAVRIGLHTGEAVAVSGRYFGVNVNRAARVCSAAHGGQAVVSPSTAALLDPRELGELTLRDLGEYELEGFDSPVRLHQLVVPGVADRFPPLRAISRTAPLRIA